MSERVPVGVVGAGSFGTAVANLLAQNLPVYLYARSPESLETILHARESAGQPLHENITPTGDIALLTHSCNLIFPVVPSDNFREMLRMMAPYLRPYHILIHGTKGLALKKKGMRKLHEKARIARSRVLTMSELILEETVVVRVGCMAGPNLAREIAAGYPAATVIASRFEEVIREGMKALRSPRFQVYGSYDITGVELAGVFKNILAIGSGIVTGLGLGENARALLITRGLSEIINLCALLGADAKSFLGLAGIGDIIATCTSPASRNYTFGYRISQGETFEQIKNSMEEVAEGVNTIHIANGLANNYKIHCPIIQTLYKTVYEGLPAQEGIERLMKYKLDLDVNFI